jgi:hypothetical protein
MKTGGPIIIAVDATTFRLSSKDGAIATPFETAAIVKILTFSWTARVSLRRVASVEFLLN